MSVEKVADKVKFSLSVQFMNMAEDNRKWLMLYTVLTGICYLFDALTFVIVLKWFSVAGKEHSELLMLFATLINFGIDMYYLLWVM